MVTDAAAVLMSEDPDLDTTRLWHMWLGHMSERELHVLSKLLAQRPITLV